MLDAFDRALTAMAYAAAGLAVFAIVWAGFVLMAEGAEERAAARAKRRWPWRWWAWRWCCRPRAWPPCCAAAWSPSQSPRAQEETELRKLLQRITRRRAPQERPEEGLLANFNPPNPRRPRPSRRHRCPCSSCSPTSKTTAPVRLDGVKLGICEVMGLELDEPKLGAFAGALNACDFPIQLLIRQHPPRLAAYGMASRRSSRRACPRRRSGRPSPSDAC